jgi:hypothetical protein
MELGSSAFAAAALGGLVVPTRRIDAAAQDAPAPAAPAKKKEKPPPLEAGLVKDFVGAAHGDLERVKAMLAEWPALVNATWDWGGGDFETALGGASHMGRPDIALYLLEHDARLDLFAAAMLGRLDIVKAALAADPRVLQVPGPHGISLIRHAEAGGESAASVLEFLRRL